MVCLRSTTRSVCGVKARKASFRRKVDRRVAKEGPSKRVKKDLSRVAIRPYLRLLEGYDPSLCPPYHRARPCVQGRREHVVRGLRAGLATWRR